MIGVKYPDVYAVTETFQLLKTEWCWYEPTGIYDVVIAKREDVSEYNGNLIDITDNDVFKKIKVLLNDGKMHLHHPNVDIYIEELRSILKMYTTLIEIRPSPWKHAYMVALTHDVDNISVKQSPIRSICMAAARCFLNFDIKSGANILLAKCGYTNDPWLLFDWWKEFEQKLGVRSTFYIIPPHAECIDSHEYRDTSYYFNHLDYKSMWDDGWEIGIHGMNNWINISDAMIEKDYIGGFIGNRTHWLLHDKNSWVTLDKAGYKYDATFGYDDDIGYRAGTLQVYQPEYVKRLLVLPLHIQDAALFGKSCWIKNGKTFTKNPCLNASETTAPQYCKKLLDDAKQFGGVITVLWHYENIMPPRNWKNTYLYIVNTAKSDGAWITNAANIVDWFKTRRDTQIQYTVDKNKISINIHQSDDNKTQTIRVHIDPRKIKFINSEASYAYNYVDIKCDRQEIEVILC